MTDDLATPDLSLVSTDDLIAELLSRYDALLIVREASRVEGTNDCWFDFNGGVSAAIGLAERAKRRLLNTASESDLREDS